MTKYFSISRIIVFFFLGILFFSCKKNDSNVPDPNKGSTNVYEPAALVSASVSAFVTDENELPVSGAVVTAGTATAISDSRGFFRIMNAQVIKNAGIVTVEKTGYFKAIKTWIAEQGKASFVRIKLLPKTSAGTVSGTTGGMVTLAGGMKIFFPANATVNAATNAAYTGIITVNAQWLNPGSADFGSVMPGDNRILEAGGGLKLLSSYGMSAVELRGAGGELLQIAPGKKATLTMPIPATLQSSAPATLPLWYFDEAKGLWKEEGTATKSGSDYTGEVSHFSYWNNGFSGPYVQFDVTVTDAGGNPVPDVMVRLKIVIPNGYIGYIYGYTNSSGVAGGSIPANQQFIMEVLASYSCQPLHTANFSGSNSNVSFGTITLLSNRTVRIFGTAMDCNSGPLVNGLVMVTGPTGIAVPVDNTTGAYAVSLPVCSGTAAVVTSVVAVDPANSVQSAPVVSSYVPGSSNNLNLQACGTGTAEFLTYTLGTNPTESYSAPADSIYIRPQNLSVSGLYTFRSRHGSTVATDIYFPYANLTVGQSYPLAAFVDQQVNAQGSNISATVTISEYGPAITGFVAGTLSGTLTSAPVGTVTINGSFRVRRPY